MELVPGLPVRSSDRRSQGSSRISFGPRDRVPERCGRFGLAVRTTAAFARRKSPLATAPIDLNRRSGG